MQAEPLRPRFSAERPGPEGHWTNHGADDAWVSATALRNFMLGDPLLDWLERYGEARGFLRDHQLPGYDQRTDFAQLLFTRGQAFEEEVVGRLRQRAQVVAVASGSAPTATPKVLEETLSLLREGAEIVTHGMVADPTSRTFGAPDLLVRSDVLLRLFPGVYAEEEATAAAPGLGGDRGWHYRVVDIKLTTLRLGASGSVAGGGAASAYRAQVFVCNRALGAMQRYVPRFGYLLGRGWAQRSAGVVARGNGPFERLGPVDCADPRLAEQVDRACAWVRRVRSEGSGWQLLPRPSVVELYPNLSQTQDSPWRHAKRRIAEDLEDLTLLWGVGPGARRAAHAQGVYSWRDPRCTPAVLGLSGERRAATLQAILDVNQRAESAPVRPPRISAAERQWRPVPPLEFYVDFETVGDLGGDSSGLAGVEGEPLVFLIGCGHLEEGTWRFASFVAESLTSDAEAAILDAWFAHMDEVRQRLAPAGPEPLVLHWSPAEQSFLEKAYNSAVRRHPDRAWPRLHWFDFLNQVVRAEPVVVRGALSFGLKPMARAFHALGLIETRWEDAGVSDGLAAAAGAWWCHEQARRQGVPLSAIPLMQDIARYNEVDCKAMMEIVRYLRSHH